MSVLDSIVEIKWESGYVTRNGPATVIGEAICLRLLISQKTADVVFQ